MDTTRSRVPSFTCYVGESTKQELIQLLQFDLLHFSNFVPFLACSRYVTLLRNRLRASESHTRCGSYTAVSLEQKCASFR